jgi:uncharacterized damage-inducible protein DinB
MNAVSTVTSHAPTRADYVRKMAAYNTWMNAKVYATAASLSVEALYAERGAFFGSVFRTLGHIVNGDTIWLKRFAAHPAGYAALAPVAALATPRDLAALPFADLAALAEHRRLLDGCIERWADAVTEADLDHVLGYHDTSGRPWRKPYFLVVAHFFNHQTHHRGQVTTLLSQSGADVGPTDLSVLIDGVG